MNDAYDCEYDMVENPTEMLEQAHARIRELEAEHASEIERLRLTDAEREAVEAAARIIDAYEEEMDGFPSNACTALRGLLKRLG